MSKRDLPRLIRFAVVGVAVALTYVALYLVLLRAGLPQVVANTVAFLLAVLLQYVGQTVWTFRKPLRLPAQALRFAATIALGLVVSALVTGVIGPALGWHDGWSALVVTVILPVQNFVIFKLWVYPDPKPSLER